MSSLKDILSDIRVFLYGGIRALPLVISGTFIILGLMTANYAMLFFLIGFLILVPITAIGIDLIAGLLGIDKWFNISQTDTCQIVIPYITNSSNSVQSATSTTFSTLWVSLMSFFFGYIISNGVALHSRPIINNKISIKDDKNKQGIQTRKTQALISIITTIVIFFIVMGYRLYSGCESKWGMILSILIFASLGNAWYKALSKVGQDRLSDLFGIANRLLPQTAFQNEPIACVPILVK